jgi:peroxiredoxin
MRMAEKERDQRKARVADVAKKTLDLVLLAAVVYVGLLALGVVKRGGQLAEGQEAPDFEVRSLADGRAIRLSELRGRPVLVNFFSIGCPACRRELPDVEAVQAEAGDRLRVLVVSNDPQDELKAYVQAESLRLPVAWDSGGAHRAYRVDTIPYMVIVDRDGKVGGDWVGGIRFSDVEPYL